FPLYSGGARLLEMYPLLPLTANVAVVTCVTSYDGALFFGVIGDYDAIRDVEVLADGIRRGFDRLEVVALDATWGSGGPSEKEGTRRPQPRLHLDEPARRRRPHPRTG
ncbi:MAG TPA: WS/DGAT domain-containing protein, partial [Candidatus Dormibacteraeota bacterium]|nr:WS/DGAT domain-containing protein [Candidatus Dormibacteraeota bacterium]